MIPPSSLHEDRHEDRPDGTVLGESGRASALHATEAEEVSPLAPVQLGAIESVIGALLFLVRHRGRGETGAAVIPVRVLGGQHRLNGLDSSGDRYTLNDCRSSDKDLFL